MKIFIRKRLLENLAFNMIETLMDEDYPQSFNMEEFKKLTSFNARVKYCEEHLQRISSGSSRIVYKVDDEKVLKLAKNKKGLVQNEVEYRYSQYHDLEDILARVFDVDPKFRWIEMELARKLTIPDFNRITGFKWSDFIKGGYRIGLEANPYKNKPFSYLNDDELYQKMWDDEFIGGIFTFISNYDPPIGDLTRKSSYGIVKTNGKERIVLIDYGLDNDVYNTYYS